jgi:5-methylcytosine-specific restriction endonuclease McrA
MRALYPANWKAISRGIRDRAGHRCEQCGVEDRTFIVRAADGVWRRHVHDGDCVGGDGCIGTFIVLTVAHLDHDPTHNAEANLRALCQRCHNRHDAAHRAANAARTRAAKRPQTRFPF